MTVRECGIHPLLDIVRARYRAQRRQPHLESRFVEWIERFLRLFPDEPLGRLALLHLQTYIHMLEQQMELSREKRKQAAEALQFLRTDVLHFRPEGGTEGVSLMKSRSR